METWEVNDEEFEAVLGQSMEKKFDYFVHKVADWGSVWMLAKGEHTLAMIDSDPAALAVWPHQRYAEACRVREWSDHEAAFVDVRHFIDVTLGEAEDKGHIIAILHSADTQYHVTIPPEELREALEAELEKY